MPSKKSLEIAAQCWCDDDTSSIEMDVRLATAFAKRLDSITIQQAMDVLKAEMAKDCEPGSYAHGWHCNIAMMCHDAIHAAGIVDNGMLNENAPHTIGNDAASRFMQMCFGVETKNEL